MGTQGETDASDDPAASEDSIESLLRSTDKDTEEIVDALRESGPRRHVSETSVDDVLTELSRPQAGDDDQFALSGGPTRTVSTNGIDEVFETLEAEAPSLPSEPRVGASTGSAGGESAVNGSGSASTAVDSSSDGTAASGERSGPTAGAVDRAGEPAPEADEDGEAFGALVGGGPTRRISETSVDDILDSLEDGSPAPDAGPSSQETGEAVDELRPADPEGELVDLLTEDESDPAAPAERPATESAGVETSEGSNQVADAAERLGERRSDRDEAAPGTDSPTAASADDAFEWVEPEPDAPVSESPSSPADDPAGVESDAVTGAGSRPLVTRAELEAIAAHVSEPESSTHESVSGPAAGSGSQTSPDGDRAAEPDTATGDERVDHEPGPSTTRPGPTPPAPDAGALGEAVTVDAVIAPTDAALGGSLPSSDASDVDPGADDSRPAASAPGPGGDRSADRSGATAEPGESVSGFRRLGSFLRRLTGRLRR